MLDKLITKAITAFVAWLRDNAWHTDMYAEHELGPECAMYTGKTYYVGQYAITIAEHNQHGNGSSTFASKQ